ncbi:MAG: NAD(P)-dependent oxidoreductase [Bacteroidales bacterium]|nr:NAD(P)-dependent oxidoreductase [Bacteroidales bacterium]
MAETEPMKTRKKVLIMGAGGFVGGFLAAEGVRLGYEVWCGLRATTSRRYLEDLDVKFVEFDFEKPEKMDDVLRKAMPEGTWDYIIYNLGATKVKTYRDFSRINHDYLRNFTEALRRTDMYPERFLYMSSLSAMGVGDEKGYTPFTEEMIPVPNTRYGASKLKAETWLQTTSLNYIIFRPTGIYGPHERDYYLMFKSIAQGFDFSVGFRKQMLTFIYVEDLVRAVYMALENAPTGQVYNISEPRAYSQKEFRRLAMREMGKKFVLPMRMPLWAVKAVSVVAEKIGVMRNKPSTLNSDKFRIMKQRNWNVDTSKAERDFGFRAETSLAEGIHKSIEWYRKAKWL